MKAVLATAILVAVTTLVDAQTGERIAGGPPRIPPPADPIMTPGIYGRYVYLQVLFDTEGNPRDFAIVRGLSKDADATAIAAVRAWKLRAATYRGHPAKVWYTVKFLFNCSEPKHICSIADSPPQGSVSWAQVKNPRLRRLPIEPVVTEKTIIPGPEIYPDGGCAPTPRLKSSPNPVYPESVKNVTGIVLITFVINENGGTENITIIDNLHPELNQAAIDAVKGWVFFPTKVDGKLVKVRTSAAVKLQPPV